MICLPCIHFGSRHTPTRCRFTEFWTKGHLGTFCEWSSKAISTYAHRHGLPAPEVHPQSTSSRMKVFKEPRWQYPKHRPQKKKMGKLGCVNTEGCVRPKTPWSECEQPPCAVAEPKDLVLSETGRHRGTSRCLTSLP